MPIRGIHGGLEDLSWAASQLSSQRGLWKWVVAPALLAGLILVAGGVLGFQLVGTWIEVLSSYLPSWLSFLGPILRLLLVITLTAAGYFCFFIVASVITTPFCELLSEKIEFELTGREAPPFSLAGFVRDLVLGIAHSVRRLASYLFAMSVLFVLSLILPVIGALLFTVGGLYLTVAAAAFDGVDCVLARKGWSYGDKKKYLREHRMRTMGSGVAVAGLLAVPVLNLFALPLGAIAATRLYVEAEGTRS